MMVYFLAGFATAGMLSITTAWFVLWRVPAAVVGQTLTLRHPQGGTARFVVKEWTVRLNGPQQIILQDMTSVMHEWRVGGDELR